DFDLELLRRSAPRIHPADSRNCAELILDRPVLKIFELPRTDRAAERVLVEFAECRRRQSHERLDALRQPSGELLQTLVYELPRKIVRNGIVKNDRHHRKTEFSQRTDFFLIGQSEHGLFDWECDELLNLGWRQTRSFGHYHHLVVRQIWKCVDGNRVKRIRA